MPGAGRRRFLLTPTVPSPLRDPRPPGTTDTPPPPPVPPPTRSAAPGHRDGPPTPPPHLRRLRAHGPGAPSPGTAPRSRGLPHPARGSGESSYRCVPAPGTGHCPGTGTGQWVPGPAPEPGPGTPLLALSRDLFQLSDPVPRFPSVPCAPVPAPLPASRTALRYRDLPYPAPNAAFLVPGPLPSPVTAFRDRGPPPPSPFSWRRSRSQPLFSYRCPCPRGHPLS